MIRRALGFLGGEGFGDNKFPLSLLLRCFFFQKIFLFNRHVDWPVHWSSKVVDPGKIVRGNRCPGLSYGCHLDGRNGIVFGNNVWVGPRVSVISMNHNVNDFSRYTEDKPIRIGKDSWLATNSVILPGVELGEHTIVAAGCVVNRSFPEGNQVLAGVPAKVIKKLDSYYCE